MLLLACGSFAAAYLHLGRWAPILQFSVAAVQAATLFILFMRLKGSSHLRWVFAMSGFVWLLFLFGLSMTDYADRGGWPPLYDPSGPSFELGHSRGFGQD
jgi:cytochrome c oxidase subunit 4